MSTRNAAGAPASDLLSGLLNDLAAESADLDARVADLDDEQWRAPTPAEGWTVADAIAHLHATDRDALLAVSDPPAFAAHLQTVVREGPFYTNRLVAELRPLERDALLDRWRAGRTTLADAIRTLPPDARIAWFGPPMRPVTFATARLMETWAHGQDVVDVLGQERAATGRLRSVADLGVRTRGFSYAVRGRVAPDVPVRVELRGPDGDTWVWGPQDAPDTVRGDALDFCLVVTRRRHRDDVALEAVGAAANEWLDVAQAYAGPPGMGRAPRKAAR